MQNKKLCGSSQVTIIGELAQVKYTHNWIRFTIRDGDYIFTGDCRYGNLISKRSLAVGSLVIVTGKLVKSYNHTQRQHGVRIIAAFVSPVNNHEYQVAPAGSRHIR
jgi:hypothetical protein